MDKKNNYMYENYDLRNFENKPMEMNLPISNPSGQEYFGLLKINEVYLQQLSKLISENNRYKKINYYLIMI